MDWLKAILEKATINDGVLDVHGVIDSVKKEIPDVSFNKQFHQSQDQRI